MQQDGVSVNANIPTSTRKKYDKKKHDESLVRGLQGLVSACNAVSIGVTEHHVTIRKPERPEKSWRSWM